MSKTSCDCGGEDCKPHENNSMGVEIQEYDKTKGWVAVTEPYECFCKARRALAAFPADGVSRRPYSALQPRSNAF